MAIEGFYSSGSGVIPAPYVRAYIDFRRLGITRDVTFLVDTGSYSTCLHPFDIARLGVDLHDLEGSLVIQSSGIGGIIDYYVEPATVMLHEVDGTPRFIRLDIHISQKTDVPEMQNLPSLLGRDFLNLCALTVDNFNDIVRLEPHNVVDSFVLPPTSP